MSHKSTVLQSINLVGEMICVDIFQRPDGTFGFDENRRDLEDGKAVVQHWSSWPPCVCIQTKGHDKSAGGDFLA